jgi:hypothetical protein
MSLHFKSWDFKRKPTFIKATKDNTQNEGDPLDTQYDNLESNHLLLGYVARHLAKCPLNHKTRLVAQVGLNLTQS